MFAIQPVNNEMNEKRANVSLDNVLRSESGMMTWGTIFAVMVLMIFLSFIANSVNTVNEKIETQNAADGVAYSSSVWVARGMNSVTATNHIIGELNALYVIHHSFGGKRLDEKNDENKTAEMKGLTKTHEGLFKVASKAEIPALALHNDIIKKYPKSDVNSTLYEAMKKLKRDYAITLGVHIAGQVIFKIPDPFGISKAIGLAMMAACLAVEFKIWQEYLVLLAVETIVKPLSLGKKYIPCLIDAIYIYQNIDVYGRIPIQAYRCADLVAGFHGAEGFVRNDTPDGIKQIIDNPIDEFSKFYPKLPIEKETTTSTQRNQLVRATYPWVCHWRYKIRDFFSDWCTISGASGYFGKWSNKWSEQTCERLRLKKGSQYAGELLKINGKGVNQKEKRLTSFPKVFNNGIKLFVMVDLNSKKGGNTQGYWKSKEKWNDDSTISKSITAAYRSDELFSLMGFAKRPKPWIASPGFFRQENPRGFVCYSQAMIYNANPQQRPAESGGNGTSQPQVGWDTLNWDFGADGSNPIEYVTDTDYKNPPRIKLNWQAKLTPLTMTKMTKTFVTAAFGDEDLAGILYNAREDQLILQNH